MKYFFKRIERTCVISDFVLLESEKRNQTKFNPNDKGPLRMIEILNGNRCTQPVLIKFVVKEIVIEVSKSWSGETIVRAIHLMDMRTVSNVIAGRLENRGVRGFTRAFL